MLLACDPAQTNRWHCINPPPEIILAFASTWIEPVWRGSSSSTTNPRAGGRLPEGRQTRDAADLAAAAHASMAGAQDGGHLRRWGQLPRKAGPAHHSRRRLLRPRLDSCGRARRDIRSGRSTKRHANPCGSEHNRAPLDFDCLVLPACRPHVKGVP